MGNGGASSTGGTTGGIELVMRWLRRHQWLILGGLVVVGAALGLIGWSKQEPDYGWVDLLYADLGLVTVWGGPSTTNNNYLGVARFLLPLALGFTAFVGLLAVLGDRVRAARTGFLKGHTVVAGGGEKGLAFAESSRSRGKDVVVIDVEPTEHARRQCRRGGMHLIAGDARDPDVLAAAGVDRARRLVVVSPTDEVNAEVALRAGELSGNRPAAALHCLLHIGDPDLAKLLRIRQVRQVSPSSVRLDFFSLAGSGAALLLQRFPPVYEADHPRTIWLVGADDLWDAFLGLIAAADADLGAPPGRTTVVLIRPDARREVESQTWKLGALGAQLSLQAVDVEPGEVTRALVGGPDPDAVYVRHQEDDETLGVALALEADLPTTLPIRACLTRAGSVAGLVATAGAAARLEMVSLIPELCRDGGIRDVELETMARAFHGHYVAQRRAGGQTVATNPSMVPWEALTPDLKQSNLDLARDIGRKLDLTGCELVPGRVGDAGGFEFAPDEVDALAPVEHDRWAREMTRLGWTYAPGDKDEVAKTSPYLVPWASVPPDIQEYDREAIRSIPAVLARVGLRIVRAG